MKNKWIIGIISGIIIIAGITWGVLGLREYKANIITPEEQTAVISDSDADYTGVRHAYKLGIQVKSDGTIYTGYLAKKRLTRFEWPDVKFYNYVPVFEELPNVIMWDPDSAKMVPNPEYYEALYRNSVDLENLLNAFQYQDYPTMKIVLLAYNPKLNWFLVPNQFGQAEQSQWVGFIHRNGYLITEGNFKQYLFMSKIFN